jgi:hypothetical protein
MTDQELYDKVCAGLKNQKWEKSVLYDPDQHFQCLYRGPNGSKCAAGHLIPDSLYQKDLMEGNSWHSIIENNTTLLSLFNEKQHNFIRRLQNAHDSRDVTTPKKLKASITKLAPKNNET